MNYYRATLKASSPIGLSIKSVSEADCAPTGGTILILFPPIRKIEKPRACSSAFLTAVMTTFSDCTCKKKCSSFQRARVAICIAIRS